MSEPLLIRPHRNTSRFSAWLRAGAIGALIALAGCAASRGDLDPPLHTDALTAIKVGETTTAQVLTLLGAPESVFVIGNQTVFHYYHWALKHGTFLVFSRVNVASDDIFVFLDQNGIVRQVLSGNRTDALKFQFWPFGH